MSLSKLRMLFSRDYCLSKDILWRAVSKFHEEADKLGAQQTLLQHKAGFNSGRIPGTHTAMLVVLLIKKCQPEFDQILQKMLEALLRTLASWLDEIVKGRRQADSLKSTVLANMWKLIGNGSYGFASLNLSKRKDVRFGELKTLKYWMTRPGYFQSYEANEIDRKSDYFEILLNKYRVQERLPLQFSCDVLSTSKRILFETVYDFCGKYFDPKKWTLLGLDTDGFAFACASQNLVDIVKPELKDEFESVKYKWLVPDEKVKREPLFLKTEMKADLAAVYLAAKSYIIVDKTSTTKTAHKGFSAKLNPELVRLQSFLHALFTDGNPETSQHAKLSGFRQNSLGQMGTYVGTRTSLSNLAIKFDYCCKDIHCLPRDLSLEQIQQLFPFTECDIVDESSVWDSICLEAENTPVRTSSHFADFRDQ